MPKYAPSKAPKATCSNEGPNGLWIININDTITNIIAPNIPRVRNYLNSQDFLKKLYPIV